MCLHAIRASAIKALRMVRASHASCWDEAAAVHGLHFLHAVVIYHETWWSLCCLVCTLAHWHTSLMWALCTSSNHNALQYTAIRLAQSDCHLLPCTITPCWASKLQEVRKHKHCHPPTYIECVLCQARLCSIMHCRAPLALAGPRHVRLRRRRLLLFLPQSALHAGLLGHPQRKHWRGSCAAQPKVRYNLGAGLRWCCSKGHRRGPCAAQLEAQHHVGGGWWLCSSDSIGVVHALHNLRRSTIWGEAGGGCAAVTALAWSMRCTT